MPNRYYAVAKGRKIGVYNDWASCKDNVTGYSGATYKKFDSLDAAKAFIQQNSKSSLKSMRSTGGSSRKYASSLNTRPICKPSSSIPDKLSNNSKLQNLIQLSLNGKESSIENNSTANNVQKIYVDGASRGNGKSSIPDSGYGVYYGENDPRNAAVALSTVDNIKEIKPTNQRAELHAMKHALNNIANDLKSGNAIKSEIYSDSKYVINTYEGWYQNWENNNWKNSKGQDVANQDIIKSTVPLYNYVNSEYLKRGWGNIKLHYVPGHSGDIGNDNADKLANLGADEMSNNRGYMQDKL